MFVSFAQLQFQEQLAHMPETPIPQRTPIDRGAGRVTVVRNINEAIKQHEVKIRIEGEITECVEIEDALKNAFNLKDAIVVPEPNNSTNIAKAIRLPTRLFQSGQPGPAAHLRPTY